MSSKDIAVSVRGLSKSYTIRHNDVRHSTMGEALVHRLKNPFQRPEKETFWALKDVEFDVERGDVIGIIGRNGAGKSTLLKILSQITEPTTGEIQLFGRVGSLLEVGTGFHPELTGRENIYLNGAILGMRRSEIDRAFDAIVDFAGVEQFLDTPVKRYSSGMYVRLAFAVAAHLRSEILVVDEVLSVGDAEFQKKCLGKMNDVAHEGRTVLFVSHNMAAVQNLCSRSILMQSGRIAFDGGTQSAIGLYVNPRTDVSAARDLSVESVPRSCGDLARFTDILLRDLHGSPCNGVLMGQPMTVDCGFLGRDAGRRLNFGILVRDALGDRIFRVQASEVVPEGLPAHIGRGRAVCRIPAVSLLPGFYTLTIGMADASGDALDRVEDAVAFQVIEADVFGTGRIPQSTAGKVYVESEWAFEC